MLNQQTLCQSNEQHKILKKNINTTTGLIYMAVLHWDVHSSSAKNLLD